MTRPPLPEFGQAEDLLLRVLRQYFYGDPHQLDPPEGATDVPFIRTLLSDEPEFPLLLVRRDKRSGGQTLNVDDQRHALSAVFTIESLCQGDEADVDSALLQEAARVALQSAVEDQVGWPDIGYINHLNIWSQPARVSDYATSSGVVQYASLPVGVLRYESIYQFIMRPVKAGATGNRFIRHN